MEAVALEREECPVSDPFLGEIKLVPYGFEPRGWAYCDGRELPINQNQALFALLGTNFGGDGRTTFGLPDLRGRVPVGAGAAATGTTYALGETGGDESVKLTVGQLPPHGHAVRASSGAATTKKPASAWPASGGAYAATSDTTMGATMIGRSGSGKAHDNRQPYLALAYVIALQGIFPSRN
jgi:microcystin-dependent protein